MARVAILFASFDGQTEAIARRIGAALERDGHAVTLRSAGDDGAARGIEAFDAAIVGGAVRYGRHAKALETLVRECSGAFARRPNAFFSVSLSAGGPGARPLTAQRQIDEFCTRTGWRPGEVAAFAGALRYRKYNPFLRLLMRLIVGAAGGDTDTSRDYEYTDWAAVERFAALFSARLATPTR
jgi:menaquinone-dependent protoporphyrinogen oxidase